MKTEQELVGFVHRTSYDDLPPMVVGVAKKQILAALGGLIAGAESKSCVTMAGMAKEAGGSPEASIFIHGGKVPAQQAAFVNSVMARALDICDSAVPGVHPGSAVIPAALAAGELAGGLSGVDFLAAVCIGTEVTLRLKLGEAEYDGFDPTGIAAPFGSTAAAAKILGLSEAETGNALGLAFCRCGGSFQANVDGALAVRVIEGWVAETGVTCTRLAERGITGPANFLEGVYGYLHLFGRGRVTGEQILSGLGTDYKAEELVFKKFPSCGATQGSTQLILDLVAEEGLEAEDVERVEIEVPPYVHKLVGHPFELGSNPKVSAQFSIRYCVANALSRKAPVLAHFEEKAIRDPEVLRLVEKIEVKPDAGLDARGHTAVDMRVVTKDSREHFRQADFAPGYPQRPLTEKEHRQRFQDCVEFSQRPWAADRVAAIIDTVASLEKVKDVPDSLLCLLSD